MADGAVAGMAVRYIRHTSEHVLATIVAAVTRGDDFFHGKCMQNGHENVIIVLWVVSSSQSNSIVVRVRYGQVFDTHILLVPRVACKHSLVQAWRPCLTVDFVVFSMLVEGGGGAPSHPPTQGHLGNLPECCPRIRLYWGDGRKAHLTQPEPRWGLRAVLVQKSLKEKISK